MSNTPANPSFDVRDLLEDRWKALGYDNLLPDERGYIVLWWLTAEVRNGSFHQYFDNSAGDSALEALAALKSLGATATYEILKDALAAFGTDGYSTDQQERSARLSSLPNQYEVFNAPTDRFYHSDEGFIGMALDRVRDAYEKHHIEHPPGKPGALRLVAIWLLVLLVVTIFVAVIVAIFASSPKSAHTAISATGSALTNSPQPQRPSPPGGAGRGCAVES
jgi:hypothetical protein